MARYLRQIINRLVGILVPPVDDIDAVGSSVGDMFLHEAAEARQVSGYTGYTHHRAFSCREKSHRIIIKQSKPDRLVDILGIPITVHSAVERNLTELS